MSQASPAISVPCPSCSGTVSVVHTGTDLEWVACPHCQHEWACPLPRAGSGPKYRTAGRTSVGSKGSAFSTLLFLSGLLLYAAPSFCRITIWSDGSWTFAPSLLGVLAVGCFLVHRRVAWAYFLLGLMMALRQADAVAFAVVFTGMLSGLLLREWGARYNRAAAVEPRGDEAS